MRNNMRQRFTSPPPAEEDDQDTIQITNNNRNTIRPVRPTSTTYQTSPPSFTSHNYHRQDDQSSAQDDVEEEERERDIRQQQYSMDYEERYDERPISYSRYDRNADLAERGGEEEGEISYDGLVYNDNKDEEYDEKDEEDDNRTLNSPYEGNHFDVPVDAQPRRNKTNRRVNLTEGNLILDCLVPSRLLSFLPRKDEENYRYTRYSAITCDPSEFEEQKFVLRQTMSNRETELMVVVTLYNEDEVLFCRTLHGIMKNIAHLCTRTKSRTWGAEGWKKVVVCIVADGRKAINPRILDCLASLGVYQEGMAKNVVDNKPVTAHIYEYTTQLSIDPNLKFKGLEGGIQPTQIIFCLKEENKKKLNSHRWAIQAFAQQLQPNVLILIDAGTKPGPKSLYHLWKTFDLHSNVAGACGEITVMKGKWWKSLLNPLVAAQNFEYKMSNILDKPTESLFGYITVLPGAFSAYRFSALGNDALGRGPLASYFKGEHLAGSDADVFTSNMYLAEDRILCWELIAKPESNWVLRYVKNASGETDVPDTIAEFISQRRRWLNGSLLSSSYALIHTFNILKTDHSTTRKVVLLFEAFYNLLNMLFAWFGIANYYIFFMVLTTSLQDPSFNFPSIEPVNAVMQYIYVGTVIASFLMSLGNRPQGSKWKYLIAVGCFSLTTAYMYAAAVIAVYHVIVIAPESSIIFTQIIVSLLATYGVYVTSSILALDPWHLVTSMLQYLLLAPVYINLLNIFAFSNLHDFSWGTKSLSTSEVDLGVAAMSSDGVTIELVLPSSQSDIDSAYDEALNNLKTRPALAPKQKTIIEKQSDAMDYYRNVRTNVLLAWALSNGLLVATVLRGDYANTFTEAGNSRTQIFMVVVLIFVAFMSLVRLLGSTAYLVIRLIAG